MSTSLKYTDGLIANQQKQYSGTDGMPGGARWHTHVLPNGDVSVCWQADGGHGERVYRFIDDIGPRRISGQGVAFDGELHAVAELVTR